MRPIDADELGEHKFPTPLTESYQQGWNDAIDAIVDNAPTVEFPEQITIKCDAEEDKQKLLSAFRNAKLKVLAEEDRPHGEWIADDYAGIHCSECEYIPLKDVIIKIYADGRKEKSGNFNLTPYCPNCGADMRKEEEG